MSCYLVCIASLTALFTGVCASRSSSALAEKLSTDVAQWSSLLNFRPSSAVQASILVHDGTMRIQPIEEAAGPNLNYDYYPVYIASWPTINGAALNSSTFLEYVRTHFGGFLNGNDVSLFQGYKSADDTTWASSSPLGTLMRFRIILIAPGFDDGSVVTSEYVAGDHWIFTPIETHDDGTHPVSGNREFGMNTASDGTPVFYTKGIDRVCTGSLLESIAFFRADDLWTYFQQSVVDFVNKNGGSASRDVAPNDRVSMRVAWTSVTGIFNPATPWDNSMPAVGPGTIHCG